MKRLLPGTGCIFAVALFIGLLSLAFCNVSFMHGDPISTADQNGS